MEVHVTVRYEGGHWVRVFARGETEAVQVGMRLLLTLVRLAGVVETRRPGVWETKEGAVSVSEMLFWTDPMDAQPVFDEWARWVNTFSSAPSAPEPDVLGETEARP